MLTRKVDKSLKPNEKNAVEYYVSNNCSQLEAWQKVHPKSRATRVNQINAATVFFKRENVVNYKNKLMATSLNKVAVTIAEVLDENSKIAFSDIRDLFDDNGTMLGIKQWPDSIAAAVSSLEVVTIEGKDGGSPVTTTKIKLWNKDSALEKLFKYFGAYELDNQQKNTFAEKIANIPKANMAKMLEKLGEIAENTEEKSGRKPKLDGGTKARRGRITTH